MVKKNNELKYNIMLFVLLIAFVIVGFKYVTTVENSGMTLTTEENKSNVVYSCENKVTELEDIITQLEKENGELKNEVDNYDDVICFNKSF